MDFYFPRCDIHLTAIPKTGCTSVMTFFTALEEFLESQFKTLGETTQIPKLDYSFLKDVGNIHALNSPVWKYFIQNPLDILSQNVFRIAILRNPFQRFISFWFDKVVNMSDPYYAKIAIELLPLAPVISLREMQKYAEKFILNLDEEFSLDPHFRPQILFLNSKVKYDLIMETEELIYLPSRFSNLDPKFQNLKDLEIPKFNISEHSQKDAFLSIELISAIELFYMKDIELLTKYKAIDSTHKALRDHLNDVDLCDRNSNLQKHFLNLSNQRDELTQQRDELTQQRDELTRLLDEHVNSRTWKFLGFYRRIRKIIDGF